MLAAPISSAACRDDGLPVRLQDIQFRVGKVLAGDLIELGQHGSGLRPAVTVDDVKREKRVQRQAPFLMRPSASRICVGVSHEWHVVLGKPFRHFAFNLCAWLGQVVVVIAPVLFQSRLVAIRPVRNTMGSDGIE